MAAHWAEKLRAEGYEADAPYNGAVWIVSDGRAACAETGNTQKIVKTRTEANVRTSAAYDRLVQYGPAFDGSHPPQPGRRQQGPGQVRQPDRQLVR